MQTAGILEVFSSIQGEGPYIGERQIFIRFADCNLNCTYCDTAKNKPAVKLAVKDIILKIKELNKKVKHRTISLTGGEPLLYAGFLEKLLPELKNKGFRIYLETNATLPRALKKILECVDIISADIKLPSVSAQKAFWRSHKEFIELSRFKKIFVKTVVSDKLKRRDFKKATALLSSIDKNITLVIQPVTSGKKVKINTAALFKLQEYALGSLKNVLVIPQIHKILGVR